MSDKITLLKNLLAGKRPPRIPYSFWTHFPEIDLDAKALAEATYTLYKDFDLDLIKSMPNGMFSIQDWGCECDFSQIPSGGVARVTRLAVAAPDDWLRLESLDVTKGNMGRELESLRLLQRLVEGEVPVIATVFSPMTTAYKLSGGGVFEHLRTSPEKVVHGLQTITETTCRFARKAVELGCAGIFLATQNCTEAMMAPSGYAAHAKPYDLEVLDAVQPKAWFNVAHVHGDRIMIDQVCDYPVHGISYHAWETPPEIDQFMKLTDSKILVGGLQRSNISGCRVISALEDLKKTWELAGGRRLLLAPGCTIRHPVESWMLKAIIAGIHEFEQGLEA